jgi:hypothetical protein
MKDHDQRLESEVAGVLSCLATRPGVHRCRCSCVGTLVVGAALAGGRDGRPQRVLVVGGGIAGLGRRPRCTATLATGRGAHCGHRPAAATGQSRIIAASEWPGRRQFATSRRRSWDRRFGALKATVRGSSPWRRTHHCPLPALSRPAACIASSRSRSPASWPGPALAARGPGLHRRLRAHLGVVGRHPTGPVHPARHPRLPPRGRRGKIVHRQADSLRNDQSPPADASTA